MSEDHSAIFDGEVLKAPSSWTRTRASGSSSSPEPDMRGKTGHALPAMNIDGPPDWSERFHEYMYGPNRRDDDE